MKTTTFRTDEEKLKQIDKMAKSLNRSRNWVINEALDRYMEYEKWFVEKVEEGIKAADNGEFASEEEMKEMFRRWGVDED